MEMETIKNIILVFGFVITIWNQNRSNQKITEEKTANWVNVNIKLDNLTQCLSDVKDEVREIKKDSVNLNNRVLKLEEQIKVCNHRIADLEKKLEKE